MEQQLGPTMKLSSNARWNVLTSQVAEANRQVDLDRVEDEVDGIFCAYLAWLWGQEDSDMVIFGDVETGYIVSPPAPSLASNGG
jgi:predicted RNase H-like nuclease